MGVPVSGGSPRTDGEENTRRSLFDLGSIEVGGRRIKVEHLVIAGGAAVALLILFSKNLFSGNKDNITQTSINTGGNVKHTAHVNR